VGEIDPDLLAFLKSLTDRALLTDARFGDPWKAFGQNR